MYTSTPSLEVKIRCPGMQARTEIARVGSHLELACIGCTRHLTACDQRKWLISERRSAFACCKARFAIEDRMLENSAPICRALAASVCIICWSFLLCRSLVAFVFDRVILRCPRGRSLGHKRSCTQRSEATSACMPIRACCQSEECTQIPILPMRTARSR